MMRSDKYRLLNSFGVNPPQRGSLRSKRWKNLVANPKKQGNRPNRASGKRPAGLGRWEKRTTTARMRQTAKRRVRRPIAAASRRGPAPMRFPRAACHRDRHGPKRTRSTVSRTETVSFQLQQGLSLAPTAPAPTLPIPDQVSALTARFGSDDTNIPRSTDHLPCDGDMHAHACRRLSDNRLRHSASQRIATAAFAELFCAEQQLLRRLSHRRAQTLPPPAWCGR